MNASPMTTNTELDEQYAASYDEQARRYDKRSFGSLRGQFASQYKNDVIVGRLGKYGALHNDSVILDCPSGTGRVTQDLVRREVEFKEIHAADISAQMLEVNKEALPADENRVTYHTANMKEFEFEDNSFDAAINTSFLYLVPRQEYPDYLKDIYRVLRPGGIAILEASNALPAYNPMNLFKVVTERFIRRKKVKSYILAWELKNAFKPFEFVEYIGVEFPKVFGSYKSYVAESKFLGSYFPLKWFSGKFTIVLRKQKSDG